MGSLVGALHRFVVDGVVGGVSLMLGCLVVIWLCCGDNV